MQGLSQNLFRIQKKPIWHAQFFMRMLVVLLAFGLVFSIARPANAAIAFRAASSGNNGGGGILLSIGTPTGTVAGDVMIAIISVRGGTGTTITATGWTAINSNDSGTTLKSTAYYRVATGSEGPTQTFSFASQKASGVISSYSGVNTSNPINAQNFTVNASSTTMTAPIVTTTVANAWVIAAYSSATGTTVSAGSSMTLRGQNASTGAGAGTRTTSGLQDIVQASAGATGTKTMTAAAAAINIGHTIALTPAPVVSYEQSAYRWFNNQDISEPLTFIKTFGGISQDKGHSMALTSDGGYISTGDTFSFGAGNTDLVISKHDKAGELEWTKTWGGTGGDLGYSVAQTSDGGYVVTGQTGVLGAGAFDVVLLKFTSDGTLSWNRTWGGTGNDYGQSLVALSDGSIVVTGWTSSYGAGVRDIILLKFNSSGTIVWDKTWGTTNEDYAEALVATSDGGFAVSGHTLGTGAGDFDQLLLKFDSTGALTWNRTWGGLLSDDGYGVTQLSDGGLLVTGSTTNYGAGSSDVSMVKYNSSGTLQWSRIWGGATEDEPSTVTMAADGGFVVSGQTNSFGAGTFDFFALKYDSTGTLVWNQTWGGTGNDTGNIARQTADNGFVFIGYTTNYGAGNWDAFIAKYDSNGTMDNCSSPMCQTPTATTSSPTVTTGNPTVTLATPGVASATPSVTAANAAYVANFIAGKYTDVGSTLAAQNTVASAPSGGSLFRLRMNLHTTGDDATPGLETFKLQYAAKGTGTCIAPSGGTPSVYTDVTTSTHIAYANNPLTGDATPLATNANDPTHGADTIVRQSYEELNNIGIRSTITSGQDGQWDFALKVDSSAPDNTRYCFRIIKSGGNLFDAYSVYPEIITPTRTIGQSSYRFYQNADSVTPGAPLAAQDTAPTIAPETQLRLRQRIAVDGLQLNTSEGNYKLQYAEKAGTCSASFGGTIYYVNANTTSTSQTKLAGSASDNAIQSGLNGWVNHADISLDDGLVTYSINNNMSTSLQSDPLQTTNYGFTIPTNATINGMILVGDFSGSGEDNTIALSKNGGYSADKSSVAAWTGLRQWGGTTDLWGTTWTPVDINSSGFGAYFGGLIYPDTSIGIDYASITVHYTIPQLSGPITFFNNASVTSGTTIGSSNDPTGRSTIYQTYNETDPYSNTVAAIPAGSDGLWDFALTSSSASAGKTYCFRTVNADGSTLNSYSSYPEITFTGSVPAPTLEQQTRGGQSVVDGIKNIFSW